MSLSGKNDHLDLPAGRESERESGGRGEGGKWCGTNQGTCICANTTYWGSAQKKRCTLQTWLDDA